MATRKSKSLTFSITGSAADLPDIIEQIAAAPGEHVIEFESNGSTLKAVTDRIRRIPRQRALNALTVKTLDNGEGRYTLTLTNTGKTATPWPKPKPKATKSEPAKSKPTPKASKGTTAVSKAISDKLAAPAKPARKRAPRKAASK